MTEPTTEEIKTALEFYNKNKNYYKDYQSNPKNKEKAQARQRDYIRNVMKDPVRKEEIRLRQKKYYDEKIKKKNYEKKMLKLKNELEEYEKNKV